MKKSKFYSIYLLFFIFLTISVNSAQGQSNKKLYSSVGLEMIFSFADVSADSIAISNVMRWAPVFNIQWLLNYDASKNFGLFTGIDVRNLGFIRENLKIDPAIKFKHRSYMLGLPVGIKIGNLKNEVFVYLGGQIEWGFAYKQKRFENNKKVDKFTEWNSKRINQWQPSAFIGIKFRYGTNIKFKYYFENFLNEDFVDYDANGNAFKPYEGQNSQIFYFSLNFMMFTPTRTYSSYVGEKEDKHTQRARLKRQSLF